MKIFKKIIFLTSISILNPIVSTKLHPSFVNPIVNIIEVFYVQQNISYDLTIFGKITPDVADIIRGIGNYQSKKMTFLLDVRHVRHIELWDLTFNQSSVIIADQQHVETILIHSKFTNLFPKELKFLVCLENFIDFEYENQLRVYEPKMTQFSYFLVDQGLRIDLMTYEYFSSKNCNQKFYVKLNSFNKSTRKWTKKLELHKKYQNFHSCIITVKSSLIYYNRRYDDKFTGFTFDFMDCVGKFRNFTVHRLPKNVKLAYLIKSKIKFYRRPDVYVITDSLLGIIGESFHITSTFTESVDSIIISPAESYSSYEKIFLPFDATTWWMIAMIFMSAFTVIFTVNFMSKSKKFLFYGQNTKMPALNVARIFFGVAQARTPRESFPRIILLVFILYCLVIRTAYQGVFYEMITTDMKHDLPLTLDDLFVRNYTIYVQKGYGGPEHFAKTVKKARG